MLTIQQRRNLEKAVRAATTAPSASNPLVTAAEQPWEEVSNVVQVKSAFGSSGVKVGVPVTTVGGSASGYSNSGNSKVSWNGSAWVNIFEAEANPVNNGNPNTDADTPYSISANYNTADAWKTFDINNGTWWIPPGSTSNWQIVYNFKTNKSIAAYKILGHTGAGSYSPGTWKLYGSGTGVFAGEEVEVDSRAGQTFGTNLSALYTCANPGSYQYYKLYVTESQGQAGQILICEVTMYNGAAASSQNLFTSTDLCGGNTYSFDPNTLHLHSTAGGTEDVTSNCMIEYSLDNKSNWSSQLTVAQFKALSKSIFAGATYLHLRFQLTGAQTLGYVTLTTDATSGLITKAGNVTITGDMNLDDATLTGALDVDDAVMFGVLSVATAAETTVGSSTDCVVIFTGSTTQTYTLPACSTGRLLTIKNRSTGAVTVNRAGADTIDGGTSATLNANDSVTLIGNGTDWTVN